jgi:hypothetical protein
VNPRLTDLGSARYRLRRPIAYTLREHDGEWVATWPTTREWGCGYSEARAVANLQANIVSLHEDLQATPDDRLGQRLQRHKRTLARLIEPVAARNG